MRISDWSSDVCSSDLGVSALITRRRLMAGGAIGAGALLAGCYRVIQIPTVRKILFTGEDMHRGLQRALTDRRALAREFSAAEMSPIFRSNGTRDPGTPAYAALSANDFAAYRLTVTGRVNRPLALSLAQLRSMPARTQIPRHDCVEGRSAIGKWTGPMLGNVLKLPDIPRKSTRLNSSH